MVAAAAVVVVVVVVLVIVVVVVLASMSALHEGVYGEATWLSAGDGMLVRVM